MLVLARRTRQEIDIDLPDGRRITVGVTRIRDGQVWLGISAPDDVKILRRELTEVQQETASL